MYLIIRLSLSNKRIRKVSFHAFWSYDVVFRKQIGTFCLSALQCLVGKEKKKWNVKQEIPNHHFEAEVVLHM